MLILLMIDLEYTLIILVDMYVYIFLHTQGHDGKCYLWNVEIISGSTSKLLLFSFVKTRSGVYVSVTMLVLQHHLETEPFGFGLQMNLITAVLLRQRYC